MKPLAAVTGSVLLALAVGATAQGLSSRPIDNPETQTLKTQVAALQARLAALEAKVDAMNTLKMHKAAP